MSMNDLPVRDFAEALAAKSSVPGGGGASALSAALGAALGSMVANYTLGKEKYADVEPDIKRLLAEAESLRGELLSCVDEDAEAFEPLSRAYAMPKDAPGRETVMEECLRAAAAVPMKIMELTCRVILVNRELSEKGSALLRSDAGTGASLCRSALYGAALNVKVNTRLMKDREYAGAVNARVEALMREYRPIADEVCESVDRGLN